MVRSLVDSFVCSFVFQSDRYCFVKFMWEAYFTNFLSDCVSVNLILLTGCYWLLWDMYSSGDSSRFENMSLYTTRRLYVFITLAIHGDKWSPSRSRRFNLGEIVPGAQTSPHFRISIILLLPAPFLVAFRRIAKSDYFLRHVCLSICQSVRIEKIRSHWTDFH